MSIELPIGDLTVVDAAMGAESCKLLVFGGFSNDSWQLGMSDQVSSTPEMMHAPAELACAEDFVSEGIDPISIVPMLLWNTAEQKRHEHRFWKWD